MVPELKAIAKSNKFKFNKMKELNKMSLEEMSSLKCNEIKKDYGR